ncbi:N-acetylneuraminate 9-O-acetyltransferase isoform X2 [Monodelphis domestica]|uniref:N-acetylneuraminate 9-O-acetyltransferase isoform X2 n=1 Tax=Monodelphis domestica TaxID=13616 RepID=UPI0024E262D9|nr:N-acetylneuraminate 9-O-acetyltransferase isoform X2 [Monodelphis domestica]
MLLQVPVPPPDEVGSPTQQQEAVEAQGGANSASAQAQGRPRSEPGDTGEGEGAGAEGGAGTAEPRRRAGEAAAEAEIPVWRRLLLAALQPWRRPPSDSPAAEGRAQEPLLPTGPARVPAAAARCCHGGSKMAALAYTRGRREINQYFSVSSAKGLALAAVLLLAAGHAALRHYPGHDSCEYLLSSGRFLGEKVWQPHSCMMHKYKVSEAKNCLIDKHIAFIGDSRIRQLFYSFVKIINPQFREEGNKHENIPFRDRGASVKVDFLWHPEVNASMKQRLRAWSEEPAGRPDVVVVGAATWSIKAHNGSDEALAQYRTNITALAPFLEKLARTSDVYWVLQDPVYEDLLSASRRMITNEKIRAYNEAAVGVLNGSAQARLRLFRVSQLIAQETIMESVDGLHLPESSRETSAMILMNVCCNKVVRPVDGSCCRAPPAPTLTQKLAAAFFGLSVAGGLALRLLQRLRRRRARPGADVEGAGEKRAAAAAPSEVALQACCKLGLIMAYFYLCDRADLFMKEGKFYRHSAFFTPIVYILVLGLFYNDAAKEFLPVYMHIRVLVAAYLFQTGYGHFSYFWIKGDFGIHRVCQVLFRLNFLVVVLCIVMDRPYQFYYFVPLVTVWFLVIYVTLALWPQITQKKANGSCVWHVGLLMKLASLFLCICFLAYSQGAFEKIFSLWPLSKCFELNGNIYEWWFRWKLDRYVVFHGMLFAFVYLALQKRQVLSEGKGEPLLPPRVANVLLFVSVVSFLTYSIWASSCKTKAECNELHPAVSVVQILAFVLIRNIPGYARSVYSSFFAWFGKISLELFICQYHIWLAADTRGVLVLIPGSPALNVTVSTFVFVCVAHEVSRITNDLAHVLIPTESAVLWKRLACLAAFFSALLLLSSVQGAP